MRGISLARAFGYALESLRDLFPAPKVDKQKRKARARMDEEITAWNREVDERNRAKRAAKVARKAAR